MKNDTSLLSLAGLTAVIAIIIMFAIYNFYRSNYMVCTNMPDGTNRCFSDSNDFIYELSGGVLTVVPHDIDQRWALATYSSWAGTQNATIISTPHWNPTADSSGLTADPTDAANNFATAEIHMENYFRGTSIVPEPTTNNLTLTSTP